MTLTREEMETIISFSEADTEATIYTCRPALWKRMESLGVKPVSQDKHSRTYEVPKAWFRDSRIGPPAKRALTEEQRERLRARMANFHKTAQ